MKKTKILLSANSIDPIFLDPKHTDDFIISILNDNALKTFICHHFSKNKVVVLNPDKGKIDHTYGDQYEEMIFDKKFLKELEQIGVSYFFVPWRISEKNREWSRKTKIKLLVVAPKQQKNFENKIYFDRFLKKFKIQSPTTYDIANISGVEFPCVVQDADGYGLFGTKFCENKNELIKEIKNANPDNVIVRKYLDGISIGVSIFLDKDGNYFVSGLRRQCFSYKKGFPSIFLGIQWIPYQYFSRAVIKRINAVLQKLAHALVKRKFVGLANMDFILYNGYPYIIECNPRGSSATSHIFSVQKLSSSKTPWNFIINSFLRRKNKPIHNYKLSKHSFDGCLLDVDVEAPFTVKKILPLGVYEYKNGKVKFVSDRVKDMHKNKNCFFLFHDLFDYKKNYSSGNVTVCTLISDFSMFDIETGEANERGKYLLEYFKNLFLGKAQ